MKKVVCAIGLTLMSAIATDAQALTMSQATERQAGYVPSRITTEFAGALEQGTNKAAIFSQAIPLQGELQALIENERALYNAIANADKATFESLVLPDGIWTTPSSFVVPLSRLSDELESFRLPKWGGDNVRVVWTDDDKDTALVLYVRTGGGTFRGQAFGRTTLVSTLWTKRNAKWLAVYHQESELVRP
jgi:hypothetical protein